MLPGAEFLADPVVRAVLTALFALVFAGAAWHKLRAPAQFEQALAAYQLLPAGAVAACARLLPWVEAACLPLLLFSRTREAGLMLEAGLLIVYAIAMAANLARGRSRIDCGCGGPLQPLSWPLVARNVLLALLALLGAGLLGPVAERALGWLDHLSFAMATLALFGLYAVSNQLLAMAARIAQHRADEAHVSH